MKIFFWKIVNVCIKFLNLAIRKLCIILEQVSSNDLHRQHNEYKWKDKNRFASLHFNIEFVLFAVHSMIHETVFFYVSVVLKLTLLQKQL